jgi:hypothetical protein
MNITHSIQAFDDSYKKLCQEKSLVYSPDLLGTIIRCMKRPLETVFTNPFLKDFQSILVQIIEHAYMMHGRRRRILMKWRKRRLTSCNTTDLSFSSFGISRVELIVDSKKYTFHAYELKQLIMSSLLHTEQYMIIDPLPIKNPYTGIPFTKSILYYLYLNLKVHPLFYYFAKVGFDPKQFLLHYEGLLRTHLIEKTILEYNDTKVKIVCKKMLEDMTIYNFSTGEYEPIVTMDKIKHPKPYLLHYYHSLFSLNPYQREIEYKSLIRKLIVLRDIELDKFMYLIP